MSFAHVMPGLAGLDALMGGRAGADVLRRIAAELVDGPGGDAARCELARHAHHPPARALLTAHLEELVRADDATGDRCLALADLCQAAPTDSGVCVTGKDGQLHALGRGQRRAACGREQLWWSSVAPGAWNLPSSRRCEDCAADPQGQLAELETDWPPLLRVDALIDDAFAGLSPLQLRDIAVSRTAAAAACETVVALCRDRIAGQLAQDAAAQERLLAAAVLVPGAWVALPGAPWRQLVAAVDELLTCTPTHQRPRAVEDTAAAWAQNWWAGLQPTGTQLRRNCCVPSLAPSWASSLCGYCGRPRPRMDMPTGGIRTAIDAADVAWALAS